MSVVRNLKKSRVNRWVFFLVSLGWVSTLVARKGFPIFVNQGVGFGMFSNYGLVLTLFGLLLLSLFFKTLSEWEKTLLIAGGVGNLGDRIVFGTVTDWLWLPGVGLWFNVADIYLTIAVCLIIWREITKNETKANNSL